ncbi:S8 family serine peptidase [Candidatus Falkowbacteria bacterium]|nr:S8 family serine peptidase [Candidatus Falkowbacteria bacterium]
MNQFSYKNINTNKSQRLLTLALVLLLVIFTTSKSQSAQADVSFLPADSILIKYKGVLEPVELSRSSWDFSDPEREMSYIRKQTGVEWVEKNYLYHAAIIPADTFYNKQWYLQKIKAPAAWDVEQGSRSITIAVIDSGVDINHQDLKNNIWVNTDEIPNNGKDDDNNGFIDDVNGWDFVNKTADPRPKFQAGFTGEVLHGTVVAGIAAAEGNNAAGVTGVAWRSRIMPLKILNDKGEGTAGNVIRAIDYAIMNGANIINLSFVGFGYSQGMDEAIRRAYEAGVVVVAAAGNEADNRTSDVNLNAKPLYPVCLDGRPGENRVIGVAATDAMDQKTYFSGYGSNCVDITAPGVSIFSTSVASPSNTLNNEPLDKLYDGYWSGTSVATPQVSGALALIFSANPSFNRKQAIFNLLNNTENIDRLNPDYFGQLGHGRLNLTWSVTAAKNVLLNEQRAIITTLINGATSTTIKIMEPEGKKVLNEFKVENTGKSGVNIATADVDGDSAEEIIVAPTAGSKPLIRIFDQKGKMKSQFMAFVSSFRGGVNVAVGDVNSDGTPEIIAAAGPGDSPQVRIFKNGSKLEGQFMAYDKKYRGGVLVSVADVDGGNVNRKDEIITAPTSGGAPEVKVFSNKGVKLSSFMAYDKKFDKGVSLAAADVNHDGLAEVVTGARTGGAPHVRVFNSRGSMLSSFYAYSQDNRDGVKVSVLRLEQK